MHVIYLMFNKFSKFNYSIIMIKKKQKTTNENHNYGSLNVTQTFAVLDKLVVGFCGSCNINPLTGTIAIN